MYPNWYNYGENRVIKICKRKEFNLTQVDLSQKSGVGLRFIRDLEQGKKTLRLDKVNQVLSMFGTEVGVVAINQITHEKG